MNRLPFQKLLQEEENNIGGDLKKTVPNRGFVPGLPRSYNLFGLKTTSIHLFFVNCSDF